MRRLIAALILLASVGFSKKAYHHPEILVDVFLRPNGDVRIVQERTYAFEGSFTFAYVDLLKKGSSGITLGGVFERGADGRLSEVPVEVTDRDRSLYVLWRYSAVDEERTFVLDYVAHGVVRRYQDCAEFYWKVVEDEHARIGPCRVRVFLPDSSPGLLKVWVHANAPPGRVEFPEGYSRVELGLDALPANRFLEVRLVADPAVFAEAPAAGEKRYERILAEEKRNFLMASLRRFVLVPLGLALLLAVPLVLLLVFYCRYGREPKVSYGAVYEHEPPREAPPLAVGTIMHQKPDRSTVWQFTFRGVFATLLDMARKRVVSIQELKAGRTTHYQFRLEHPELVATLDAFERDVAAFLFEKVAGFGNPLTDERLRKYLSSHQLEVRALLDRLDADANSWWRRNLGVSLLDQGSERAYRNFMLVTALALVAAATCLASGLSVIVSSIGFGALVIGVGAAVAAGLVFSAAGRVILRWDEIAYLEHLRWKKFRKFLVEFSAIEQAPVSLLGIWEHYYSYAVALGVARQFLANVQRLAAARRVEFAVPAWYVAAVGSGVRGDAGLAGFSTFASNFTAMVSSFTSSASHGGGFSGGGGGGGGGGSSGAG